VFPKLKIVFFHRIVSYTPGAEISSGIFFLSELPDPLGGFPFSGFAAALFILLVPFSWIGLGLLFSEEKVP